MRFNDKQVEGILTILQNNITRKTEQSLIEYEKTLLSVVEKLESCGWTLPTELGIYAINVIGKTDKISDIDKFFVGFFSDNRYEHFNNIIKKILESPIEDGLKKLIEECKFAFENKKYAICADSLISAIEGILSTFWDNKSNTKMMQVCKAKVDEFANETEHITKKYLWISYDKFIRRLYEKNDFADDEPSFINRHWLLHGRSAYEIDETDCLRLFNAISSICVIKKNEK
ncbi:MAG: hypothetical protein E7406_03725 [Ruminococcaceae bacterium]|nr:hypothetical protein [Oscillospiraceae bacterium]